MAGIGITDGDVWQAADELTANGVRATLAAVRKKLGGGSYTTISEAMQVWRGRENAKLIEDQAMPKELRSIVDKAIDGVWQAARSCALSDMETDRQRVEEERAVYEVDRIDMTEKVDELQILLGDAKCEIDVQKNALEEALRENELLLVSDTSKETEIKHLKEEIKGMAARLDSMQGDVAREHSKNDELQRQLVEIAMRLANNDGGAKK